MKLVISIILPFAFLVFTSCGHITRVEVKKQQLTTKPPNCSVEEISVLKIGRENRNFEEIAIGRVECVFFFCTGSKSEEIQKIVCEAGGDAYIFTDTNEEIFRVIKFIPTLEEEHEKAKKELKEFREQKEKLSGNEGIEKPNGEQKKEPAKVPAKPQPVPVD